MSKQSQRASQTKIPQRQQTLHDSIKELKNSASFLEGNKPACLDLTIKETNSDEENQYAQSRKTIHFSNLENFKLDFQSFVEQSGQNDDSFKKIQVSKSKEQIANESFKTFFLGERKQRHSERHRQHSPKIQKWECQKCKTQTRNIQNCQSCYKRYCFDCLQPLEDNNFYQVILPQLQQQQFKNLVNILCEECEIKLLQKKLPYHLFKKYNQTLKIINQHKNEINQSKKQTEKIQREISKYRIKCDQVQKANKANKQLHETLLQQKNEEQRLILSQNQSKSQTLLSFQEKIKQCIQKLQQLRKQNKKVAIETQGLRLENQTIDQKYQHVVKENRAIEKQILEFCANSGIKRENLNLQQVYSNSSILSQSTATQQ